MKRRLTPELMDDPSLSADEHRRALKGLRRINRVCRVAQTLWPLVAAAPRPSGRCSLLDVAAGSADVSLALARRARAAGWTLDLTVCDISPVAGDVARQQAAAVGLELTCLTRRIDEDSLPSLGLFDVVLCSLFLHHLSYEDTVRLLRGLSRITTGTLVINDLVRSRRHLALAMTCPQLLTRSRVVHTDAVKSVRAAYSIPELRSLAQEAGIGNAVIQTVFPQRVILSWHPPAR